MAADASRRQAALAYVPHFGAKASYTRLSDIGAVSFGDFAEAPRGTPLGPLTQSGANGTPALTSPLSNVPLRLFFPDNQWTLDASVTVPVSDYVLRLSRQYASAEHSAEAASLMARASKSAVGSNAQIQYYAWARARLEEIVARDTLEQLQSHGADARAELDAGKTSQADLMSVEAQLAQAETLVARARSAVLIEEDRLRTLLHDRSETHYEIGEMLLATPAPLPGEQDFLSLFDEGLRQRPELRAASATARGLREQAEASRIGLYPRLDAVGDASYANPNPRYFPPSQTWHTAWSLGAALTWSSVDAIVGGTTADAANARASGAEAHLEQLEDALRDEVMTSWRAVKDAEVAVESTKRSLASAEESYRVRRVLFRVGRATSTELTDSETALTQARFEDINAHMDLRIGRVRLLHAVGRDDVSVNDERAAL
jgi:outer membrane protein TolC